MTHDDLVLRGVAWLRRHHRCSRVFAEMVTGAPETPDLIGWRLGFSMVVECKVSRSDMRRDSRKAHAHESRGMGAFRWYLIPAGLHVRDLVPAHCGLAEVDGCRVRIIVEAPYREQRDMGSEAQVLLSALRRMEMGVPFDRRTGRWEPYAARSLEPRT